MGVRGLATYVAKNADRYLEPHELQNCTLVIDGNSIASLLYNWHAQSNCAFGGDYDKYAHCVHNFLVTLKKCGVSPFVIFDGGYELKKLKTVKKRLANKINLARHVTPVSGNKFFPLLMKEVFKDTLKKLNIPFAQCFLEADDEIAAIARHLQCPVLSYDSDFYVYNVMYIPFPTMGMEVCKKYNNNEQKTEFYMNCRIYQVENFLKQFGGLQSSLLPLMATLLGNDYMSRNFFRNFMSNYLKMSKKRSLSFTHNYISSLLRWLKTQTPETAQERVLSTVKLKYRSFVNRKIRQNMEGYTQCNLELLSYLPFCKDQNPDTGSSSVVFAKCANTLDVRSNCEEETSNSSEVQIEISTLFTDPSTSVENESYVEDTSSSIENESSVQDSDEDTSHSGTDNDDDSDSEALDSTALGYTSKHSFTDSLPLWFKDSFHRGNMPSYFMDMITRQTYYCPPQVEDYSCPYSHEISLPIISAIFKFLIQGSEKEKPLLYYRRNRHSTASKRYLNPDDMVDTSFHIPSLKEFTHFPVPQKEATNILFGVLKFSHSDQKVVGSFPDKWKLFLIALIYWGRHCTQPVITNCHIHALLLNLVAMNVIDKNVGYIRSKSAFSRVFGSKLKVIRDCKLKKKSKPNSSTHDVGAPTDVSNVNMSLSDMLCVITQDDCIQVAESLLPYHQVNDRLKDSAKLYSIATVHAFAQFQSCLFHIIHLNVLLNFPMVQCKPAKFFSGTFVYNMYTTLKKCKDVDSFIRSLIRCGASVSDVYNVLYVEVQQLLPEVSVVNKKHIKQRCARTRNISRLQTEDNRSVKPDDIMSAEEEDFQDMNNKFSLLAKIS